MSDATDQPPPFHTHLEPEEVELARLALNLLISDEAHEPQIRAIAREVLAQLDAAPEADGRIALTLSPPDMKITHSAVHLLLNDTQREQADEREILRRILAKLPDEHVMRAITLE